MIDESSDSSSMPAATAKGESVQMRVFFLAIFDGFGSAALVSH
jgi:hypothetical protein